ncbi:uncharacterized short-chain type dehydrogenase/reductase y4vI-like [Portunus trituberculatus]|nr:uncharacterized short-chain type dehydrogenase/reductase y4vI-like [Portunus trituberculatus]
MALYDFSGQVALVTGGGGGIGCAVCLLLAQNGASVVVADVNLEAARQTISKMSSPVNHLALNMDVTQQSSVEGAIAASRDRYGVPPSLLVNCAGIADISPFLDITGPQLDKMIDINLKGTFLVTQQVIKTLLEEGRGSGEGRGAIVNISSMVGKTGFPNHSHYVATKGGVIAFTKSCAAEVAKKGIRVNCVLPGYVDTHMCDAVDQELVKWYLNKTPLGRPANPAELAEVIVFLLSKRSSYMVGACVEVSGGADMQLFMSSCNTQLNPHYLKAVMAPNDFSGQVALVTGGGSGIGRATCLMLARDGARVVVTDINLEAARETLSLMPNHVDHLALEMDVTQQSAVEGVIAVAQERFGEPPSLLVNNAGIARGSLCHLMEEKDFDIVVNVNLKGTFLVSQAFIRALLKDSEAGKRAGAIVNMSSIDGKSGHEKHCQYSATKGGLVSLTKSCAAELAKKGIRVNCVLPGAIDTRMTAAVDPEMRKRQHERTPIGRTGRPEEVAEVIVFLLSWRSSYMVGACVEITGGLHM